MEYSLDSIFNYQLESTDQLRQKLVDTMIELENTRNIKNELLKLLEIACKERDQAKEQLQILVKKLGPSTSNMFYEVQQNNLVMLQSTKANSSITESNSPSHVSSLDSLIEAVSSPEFSNNKCEIDDIGNGLIDFLAKGKVLPQKGQLLEAVTNVGPLLQNLLLSGPLPTWKNPPPLSSIKIPPFAIDEPNSFQNSILPSSHSFGSLPIQNSTLPSSHSFGLVPLQNIDGVTPSSCNNNNWQFTSNSSLKKQKHQYF